MKRFDVGTLKIALKMVRYNELKCFYDVEKTIGCGGFAKVKLATHLATGEKVAIKIMDKASLGDDLPRVKLELKALMSFSHQHICKLYQVIESDSHFFLVMEYCAGGELFDHIVERNRLTEAESRTFFRQIVSAVAYLHHAGYAHRDLKPENVLIDKEQNLKLIDFGLCACPQGGIASPLFTSCGSPTYAAPELVLGKKYQGPEVDVWAMGVLLYALLAGALPFDDLNIDSLYKKILSGRYEEPAFMSSDSKRLIKSMLQVDPKKRISVTELLSHPWLTLNILDPVDYRSYNDRIYDKDAVNIVAAYFNTSAELMWKVIKKWKYDYCTATYFLVLARKKRGSAIKMSALPGNVHLKLMQNELANVKQQLRLRMPDENCDGDKFKDAISSPATPYYDCVENADPVEFAVPPKPVAMRKAVKRMRSPTLGLESSPVPSKKSAAAPSTPKTPESTKRTSVSTPKDTPSGSARRVLGNIERSLHKVRHVLTPSKKNTPAENSQPSVLSSKNLCNVSTTECNDPELVITELAKAFQIKGFQCVRKGFILRGKVEANVLHTCNGCSFELEICYLPFLGVTMPKTETPTKSILMNGPSNTNTPVSSASGSGSTPQSSKKMKSVPSNETAFSFVGIKRKRLKGDSWCYKKVCEEILSVTTKDLHCRVSESAV